MNACAGALPNCTAFVPVKFRPEIKTTVPVLARSGVKDVIIGSGMKVKPCAETLPPGVPTRTSVFVGAKSAGIRTVICVGDTTVNGKRTPPKLTNVVVNVPPTVIVPLKFDPVMTTVCPTRAAVGAKLVMLGNSESGKTE